MGRKFLLAGIFLALWMPGFFVNAQNNRQASLEGESKGYFEKKDYVKALEGYNRLLSSFPKDPRYNYYTGVCLTELNQEPEKAIYRLKTASIGKDIPVDVFFYLGKANYQGGHYQEAIDYFTRFRDRAGIVNARSYHVNKWITQCHMYMDNPQGHAAEKGQAAAATETNSYQEVAARALKYQHMADSVRTIINMKENRMRFAVDDERTALLEDIARLNRQAGQYQREADKNFFVVREYETRGDLNPPVTAQNYQTGDDKTEVLPPNVQLTGKGPSPFLELTGDDFYKNPGFRKIFFREDIQLLEEYHSLNLEGNHYMKDAWNNEREIGRQQMIINTSSKNGKRKKAQQQIDKLQQQKKAKRLKAVQFFQQANDGEYALNNKYIESFVQLPGLDEARKIQGERYRKEAERSHGKALILRDKAAKFMNYSNKYGLLMEANAYELTALDNQRKALATYAGLMPASAERDMVHAAVAPPVPGRKPVTHKEKSKSSPSMEKQGVAREKEKNISNVKKSEGAIIINQPEASPVDKNRLHEKMLSHYTFGFEMWDTTAYPDVKDIPENNAMPPGVNYRIQVGVFRNPPDISYFKGMYPMVTEKISGKNLFRFYTGLFRTYGKASTVLLDLRNKGYKDAIIAGFYNGKRTSVSRIQSLEDELPYSNLHPQKKSVTETKEQKVSPANISRDLLFRVQLGVFSKPLPIGKLKELEKFSGRGYVVIRTQNNQGLYVYSIGNFTTFEKAKNFRNKLAESGISGCFVTAYKNGVRIPLSEIEGI